MVLFLQNFQVLALPCLVSPDVPSYGCNGKKQNNNEHGHGIGHVIKPQSNEKLLKRTCGIVDNAAHGIDNKIGHDVEHVNPQRRSNIKLAPKNLRAVNNKAYKDLLTRFGHGNSIKRIIDLYRRNNNKLLPKTCGIIGENIHE